jgi:transcriptional regulator with XRE-family HTH domain
MNMQERLKAARKHAQLTQVQVAEKLKGIMTQQSLSQLESGETKGSFYIVQIALACGVEPVWLAELMVKYTKQMLWLTIFVAALTVVNVVAVIVPLLHHP